MDCKYIPRPVDTSSVELPEELLALSEELARNVHEVWALNRFNEGWTYGLERDDALKKTPCLTTSFLKPRNSMTGPFRRKP